MPMVNGKEFPYTAQGKKAARDYKSSLNKKTKKNKTVKQRKRKGKYGYA